MINFADLIHDLGELMGETFEANHNRMAHFVVDDTISVNIESDFMGDFVLLMATIAELPPGRFRENVLYQALKANYLLDEKKSILCYEDKTNKLLLFLQLPMHAITAQSLLEELVPLVKRAELWKESIERGNVSPGRDEVPEPSRRGSLPF